MVQLYLVLINKTITQKWLQRNQIKLRMSQMQKELLEKSKFKDL
ncbi:unnamed protein product [Paramecium sonneborni]|uniref:Uncharacterized protein n=1 Tax=Paramecium sonneborni TaxID=65129 RepID=A0A8S1LPA6_9CILI|nr:unnamed protein product [Paramecium sonneborni]